ncbi:ER chaperone SHR3 ue Psh3 [Schizosaccharomyces japonicus yFS275]|uniref:ER chaperone SHR3 ue Psh3 n=1 Tax=Schizosaccharomyces japonicus (strain yFS275 / FY16936) TaxID=402676 RepID=B6K7H2_SCHJY|nr:ER chaperone SHR3 ue Psh3 [Schizosaccharomyces japonicus yFS275]EEB09476.2 ER chaperone SHR3 ue Psh3 [Schizosaccharomyces japonicus yFS275]
MGGHKRWLSQRRASDRTGSQILATARKAPLVRAATRCSALQLPRHLSTRPTSFVLLTHHHQAMKILPKYCTVDTLKVASRYVIIISATFLLGLLFQSFSVDYYTLWRPSATVAPILANSTTPRRQSEVSTGCCVCSSLKILLYVVFVPSRGLCRPGPAMQAGRKAVHYTSMGLYVASIVLYLINVVPYILGVPLRAYHQYPRDTYLAVLAASQVLVCFLLVGVLILQLGYTYACHISAGMRREYESANASGEKAAATESRLLPRRAEDP